MAVERLTDYTRRIWTALGTDDPAVHDIQVNDVIYYMDSSECCVVTHVYPDGSIDCETLPDVGGGGGAGINLRLLGSGTYTQLSDTTRNIVIPTELGQYTTKILFTVESVDKTAMSSTRMAAWYRMYHVEEYFNPDVFPNPSEAMYIIPAGNHKWVARTSGNENYTIWATADPGIGVTPAGSGNIIYAGEYNWKVWGI